MPRPRRHDLCAILDAAERIVVEGGREALTVRALTRRTGASNGAIYHAFGRVEAVAAHAWLRRARRFLEFQREHVARARGGAAPGRRGVAAVVAAADAVAAFGVEDPLAAALLTRIDRDSLLADEVYDGLADRLRALDAEVAGVMRELAEGLWGRWDGETAAVMRTCLVRLPAALVFPSLRRGRVDPRDRDHLRAAVGAVLALPLPPRESGPSSEGDPA